MRRPGVRSLSSKGWIKWYRGQGRPADIGSAKAGASSVGGHARPPKLPEARAGGRKVMIGPGRLRSVERGRSRIPRTDHRRPGPVCPGTSQ